MIRQDIFNSIKSERERAISLHTWPDKMSHQIAVIIEESGEAVRAALNHVYANDSIEEVKKEVTQVAATAYRLLENNGYSFPEIRKHVERKIYIQKKLDSTTDDLIEKVLKIEKEVGRILNCSGVDIYFDCFSIIGACVIFLEERKLIIS